MPPVPQVPPQSSDTLRVKGVVAISVRADSRAVSQAVPFSAMELLFQASNKMWAFDSTLTRGCGEEGVGGDSNPAKKEGSFSFPRDRFSCKVGERCVCQGNHLWQHPEVPRVPQWGCFCLSDDCRENTIALRFCPSPSPWASPFI